MDRIQKLTNKIVDFCEERDWKQFHNPKDLAVSLVLEAGEVLEHFQWKSEKEIKKYLKTNKEEIGEELADVLYWILLASYNLKIDVLESLDKKIKKNAEKYPIEKCKGKHTKYNKL